MSLADISRVFKSGGSTNSGGSGCSDGGKGLHILFLRHAVLQELLCCLHIETQDVFVRLTLQTFGNLHSLFLKHAVLQGSLFLWHIAAHDFSVNLVLHMFALTETARSSTITSFMIVHEVEQQVYVHTVNSYKIFLQTIQF